MTWDCACVLSLWDQTLCTGRKGLGASPRLNCSQGVQLCVGNFQSVAIPCMYSNEFKCTINVNLPSLFAINKSNWSCQLSGVGTTWTWAHTHTLPPCLHVKDLVPKMVCGCTSPNHSCCVLLFPQLLTQRECTCYCWCEALLEYSCSAADQL